MINLNRPQNRPRKIGASDLAHPIGPGTFNTLIWVKLE
jgi:hypothetical protein